MNLLWKLLGKHVSVPQFAGFVLADLLGMLIVLFGWQFYKDVSPALEGGDNLFGSDYVIVNKKVGLLSGKGGFSDKELKTIREQPFAREVGVFSAASYEVFGDISVAGVELASTELFFESVPDSFVDFADKDRKWTFDPESGVVPIIIPKAYINVYNFGFAPSRSLPKVSGSVFGHESLNLILRGNGARVQVTGKVVGLSSRLNTILVPQSFMEWSNGLLGTGSKSPSRVIVKVDNVSDSNLSRFLESHNYETEGDSGGASRMSGFLRIVAAIVVGIGIVICLLSFMMLVLSIYLLVEKNSSTMEDLVLAGYSRGRISRPYIILAVSLNALSLAASLALVAWLRTKYIAALGDLLPGIGSSSMMPAVLLGAGLFVLVSLADIFLVVRKVKGVRSGK